VHPAGPPDAPLDETPTAVTIRQILGSVGQLEKDMLIAKLTGARDRKKAETGKCGAARVMRSVTPRWLPWPLVKTKRMIEISTATLKRCK
jgi:hypothetical protein